MARVQGNGGRVGTLVGLVIFAIASVVLLLVSIILYTKIDKAEQTAKAAKTQLAKYASQDDMKSTVVEHYGSNYPKDGTVLSQMLKANARLKQQFIGVDTTATLDSIRKRLEADKISQSLLPEVSSLKSQIATLQKQLKAAQDARDQAVAAQKATEQQVAQIQQQFAQAQQSLENTVQQRVGQVQSLEDQTNNLQTSAQQQVQQARDELSKKIEALRAQKEQLSKKAAALEQKIEQMTGQPGASVAQDYFVSADGHITAVIPGADKVAIDLGHDQHMLLGMTFEVFDGDKAVKLAGSDVLQGKATIQVVEVNKNSSMARVVWRAQGATLSQGDQIVNLVYNPKHPFTFAVYGKFDIDGGGTPTAADRRRVDSMIRRWGGKVADSLGYNVDFVVLGQKPVAPKPLPAGTVNAEAITKHTAEVKAYQQYQNLIAKAKRMSIPVLNQNRFLTLVGYYQR